MPGRLRQGTGVSDKAQNCCNKCCEMCCRLSPWNKVICYSMIALILGSLVLIIGGAFATEDVNAENICSQGVVGTGSGEQPTDPKVPVVGRNIFAWWLANAGIFCMIMVIMTFVCCFSYITLCCGFKFHLVIKLMGVGGLVLLGLAFILFVVWLALGTYLIGLFGPRAIFEKVCRGIVVYVIFMYLYVVIFVCTCIAAVLFSLFGGKDDPAKKGRESAKSQPKLPPTKMLTAMV